MIPEFDTFNHGPVDPGSHLSFRQARREAALIEGFWRQAGFDKIAVEVIKVGSDDKARAIYAVRSNLINGLPPR